MITVFLAWQLLTVGGMTDARPIQHFGSFSECAGMVEAYRATPDFKRLEEDARRKLGDGAYIIHLCLPAGVRP